MERETDVAVMRPFARRALPVVVVCAVVAALVLALTRFRAPGSRTVSASSWSQLTTGGPSARVEAGGLVMTLSLQPGPYFLGELVAERITLANNSMQSYSLSGVPKATPCEQPLGAFLSGGTPPTYSLPTVGWVSCTLVQSALAAGQTRGLDDFLVLTASGKVTVTASAAFRTTVTRADGTVLETSSPSPFRDRWPTLRLNVLPYVPVGRTIGLRSAFVQGTNVITVDAPRGAQSNLYYVEVAYCQQAQDIEEMTRLEWQHLSGSTLDEPACDGTHGPWSYSIGAPGYAIASGKMG